MSFRARLNVWMFILGFGLATVYYFNAYAQENSADYSQKLGTQCSGHIADLNCYKDIIKREAHRMNVNEGLVPATEQDFLNRDIRKATYQGQKILVDIQDREACSQVKSFLESGPLERSRQSLGLESLCQIDPKWPDETFRSITVMWETREEFITPLNVNFLSSTEKNLVNDTRNLSVLMAAAWGFFWISPESISNWDKDKIKRDGFFKTWSGNVSSKPVRDSDSGYLNYVAHPYAGSVYYSIGRSNGLSKLQSFGYSVLMSTFFWEYGFEATVEKPSIQDLIITPVIGSIVGEAFYQWAEKIKQADGRVLGSRAIGSLLLFVLNPAEKLSKGINKILGSRVIRGAKSELVVGRKKDPMNPQNTSSFIGIQLRFEF